MNLGKAAAIGLATSAVIGGIASLVTRQPYYVGAALVNGLVIAIMNRSSVATVRALVVRVSISCLLLLALLYGLARSRFG